MDAFFGILIVIFLLLMILGPALRRWVVPLVQNWMLGRMEDNMRRMAGMPTRKEEKKARKRREASKGRGSRSRQRASAYEASSSQAHREAMNMLRVVAEDVEFTEIREFSEEINIGESSARKRVEFKVESQVEDAEFTEIKSPK